MTDRELVSLAHTMLERAYAPYSHFPVGALAVISRGDEFCWPCGACRQMLYEFQPNLRILVARSDQTYKEVTLDQLMPHGFGPKHLKEFQ